MSLTKSLKMALPEASGNNEKVDVKGCKTLKTRTFSKSDCLFGSKMIAAAAFVLF